MKKNKKNFDPYSFTKKELNDYLESLQDNLSLICSSRSLPFNTALYGLLRSIVSIISLVFGHLDEFSD